MARLFDKLLKDVKDAEKAIRAKKKYEQLHLVKKNPILKLPRFSLHRIGGEKARQFQSWNFFL